MDTNAVLFTAMIVPWLPLVFDYFFDHDDEEEDDKDGR